MYLPPTQQYIVSERKYALWFATKKWVKGFEKKGKGFY
jgi:hypothetical protein